jgi:hypothetical protein
MNDINELKKTAQLVIDADNKDLAEMREYASAMMNRIVTDAFKSGVKLGIGVGVVTTLAAYAVTVLLAKVFFN